MKLLKYIALTLLMINFYSCESNDGPEENTNPLQVGVFNINYNNAPLVLSGWIAERDGDYFRIKGSKNVSTGGPDFNSNDFVMFFHKDGTLLIASMYDTSASSHTYETTFYYSEKTFNFEIEKIDEVNHTIKINFSGKLFDDGSNDDEFRNINGSLLIPYQKPLSVSGFLKAETTMKVNGNDWRGRGQSSNQDMTGAFGIQINGDKAYSLYMTLPKTNLKVGTYNFNKNSDIYKINTVSLLRYYPGEISPNEFVCTGSLTITSIKNNVEGTFSFTAYDPITGENVSITNGVFSEDYNLN